MPSGRIQSTLVTSNTWNTLYTVPTAKVGSVSLNMVNVANVSLDFSLAVTSNATPTTAEHIEFGTSLASKAVYERTGLVLEAAQKIVVYTTANTSLAANVFGYEENA